MQDYKQIVDEALKNGYYKKYIPLLLELLKKDQNNLGLLCGIGILYDHEAQLRSSKIINYYLHFKALRYYKKTLKLKNNYTNAILGIARIYWHLNKPKKAMLFYKKALEDKPGDIGILGNIANIYKQIGAKEKAIELFEDILKKKTSFGIYFNYARLLLEDKNLKKAYEVFTKGKELATQSNLSEFEKKIINELEQKIKNNL